MTYTAPVAEQRFVLETVADLDGLARLPPFSELTPDLLDSVLEGAAQLSGEVFAPLNRVGDRTGARWEAGTVTTPAGFAEAYQQYAEGGWSSLAADPEFGGQGLPFVVACAVQEQLTSANMGFALCMMLTTGAIETLESHASPAQKELYLSRLISGQWTGTMQLTEPQAGSDVGAVRTRAERQADGTYLIKGQKIFITWGEHDCAENIIHMVLARTPDAPPGTRGLSLFIVPKFLVDEAGNLGERNDVTCASIEHKLGIHSSPTCTMALGDKDRCVGYLVGEECRGMAAMFTMMNNARVNVGLQGVAIAERAYQGAVAYARTRVQSVPYGSGGKSPARIIEHPDIRRLLLTVRACTEACRALTYLNAAAIDRSHAETDPEAQRRAQGLADLLTPITKGFSTDMGVELASLALQVYGGMGYVEESGAPQHYRDSRIAPIYEGTNGIQALDLIGRKLSADGGARCRALLDEIEAFTSALPTTGELAGIAPRLRSALAAARSATDWLLACQGNRMRDAAAGATPYLRLLGLLVGGWLLAKQAQAALDRMVRGAGDREFLAAKLVSARFYANQILPQTEALVPAITDGADVLFALKEEQFGA